MRRLVAHEQSAARASAVIGAGDLGEPLAWDLESGYFRYMRTVHRCIVVGVIACVATDARAQGNVRGTVEWTTRFMLPVDDGLYFENESRLVKLSATGAPKAGARR